MLNEQTQMMNPSIEKPKTVFITASRAEEYLIQQARRNPADFIYYLTERKPARHHLEWMMNFLNPKISHVNIVAPRESAKTTISVYYLAWLIGKQPYKTHFIGSVSFKQAADRLEMLKEIITTFPRYKNAFPWIHLDTMKPDNMKEFTIWSEKWSESGPTIEYTQYRSALARLDLKNPTCFAAGIGSSEIIGRRFSGITLLDDPHDEQNSATEDQRNKVEDFLNRTLLPCRQEGGKAIVISTRWARTDLSGRLKEKNTIWTTIDTPAISPDGSSYWNEWWPIERLERKREEIGEVMFQTMYLNNPDALSSSMFSIDHLRQNLPSFLELKDRIKTLFVTVDLALSTKTAADYTVAMAIARDDEKPYRVYILDLIRGKWDFHKAVQEIADFSRRIYGEYNKLDSVLFESQGFQPAWVEELREKYPDLPLRLIPIKGDKGMRLNNAAVKAQRGLLHICLSNQHYPALCSELISFPRAQHDDIADALSLGFQVWGTSESGVGTIIVKSPFLV